MAFLLFDQMDDGSLFQSLQTIVHDLVLHLSFAGSAKVGRQYTTAISATP